MERQRLLLQVAKLDAEVSEAAHAVGECASELERFRLRALAAGPCPSALLAARVGRWARSWGSRPAQDIS